MKAGKTKIKCFTIDNPHEQEVTVNTVKFPATKTIVLHGYSTEESKRRAYKIPPHSCVDVRVAWTPRMYIETSVNHTAVSKLPFAVEMFELFPFVQFLTSQIF